MRMFTCHTTPYILSETEKNNDVVIPLNVCCMEIVIEYDRNHPEVLLRAIEMFPFLMGAAAKPLNMMKGIKNIKRHQQVFKALEGLVL